jgi:hypothetical protein
MKKFWIVLLALALVAGLAMSASAADVKFSGSYYVFGIYADNPSYTTASKTPQAFYHQRLRIQTEFKVAEGLSLVTRFDALEKPWGQWGADSWRQDGAIARYDVTNRRIDTAGIPAGGQVRIQENIEFERAYIDFTTKIGRFNVGYQNFIAWGTGFLDTHATRPGIKYFVPVGPLTIVAALEKVADSNAGNGTASDADGNIYDIGAIYKFGAGEAGFLYQYGDQRYNRPAGVAISMHILNPYAKMKFGPVYFEAEGVYGFGKWRKWESPVPAGTPDVDAEAYGLYLHGKADIGPAYVGGIFAFMSGDGGDTPNKVEGGVAGALLAGQAWDPCLILWNDALYGGQHRMPTPVGVFFDNALLLQLYGGFKPTKDLDIMASLTYARADRAALVKQEYDYGYELDLVAKYKVFDNLEYMIGGGYHFVGDFFKGANKALSVDNNYMLIHKLTLSF